MSMFFCSSCDNLVDSDQYPEFDYDESTLEWTCSFCIENQIDEQRKLKKDWDSFDLYNDPVLNWSGLR